MHATVYRVATVLCALVTGVPRGTNWGLVLVFWMLLTGRLLAARVAGRRDPLLSLSSCVPVPRHQQAAEEPSRVS